MSLCQAVALPSEWSIFPNFLLVILSAADGETGDSYCVEGHLLSEGTCFVISLADEFSSGSRRCQSIQPSEYLLSFAYSITEVQMEAIVKHDR